jgi:hypothetical protein
MGMDALKARWHRPVQSAKDSTMRKTESKEPDALSRGAYSASEGLRLLNFSRGSAPVRHVSRNTVARWLRGYDFGTDDAGGHSEPLWRPDYSNEDDLIELSFRDLIEHNTLVVDEDVDQILQHIKGAA